MRDFFEDYGEFVTLSIVIVPAIAMFYRIGVMVGQMSFLGG